MIDSNYVPLSERLFAFADLFRGLSQKQGRHMKKSVGLKCIYAIFGELCALEQSFDLLVFFKASL